MNSQPRSPFNAPGTLPDLLSLTKPEIAGLSALTAMAGFLLSGAGISARLVPLFGGFLLVTAGASALNNIQDGRLDSLMSRTVRRPLPSGRVRAVDALCLCLTCFSAGFLVLGAFIGSFALAVSLLAVLWYNGIYAVLKRRSRYASFVGAFAGLAPPAAGWIAGGGALDDRAFAGLVFLFLIWQAPHFMLHQLLYWRDYDRAGLPSVGTCVDEAQLSRMTFAWLAAASAAFAFAPLFGLVRTFPVWLFILAVLVHMLWRVGRLLASGTRHAHGTAFRQVSVSVFAAMLLLSLDGVLSV